MLLALVTVLLMSPDFSADEIDLATPLGWLHLVVPYLPLIALMFGAVPGALMLLFSLGMLLVFLAIGGSAYQIAQLTFPATIVIGLCAFLLPVRVGIGFATLAMGLVATSILIQPDALAVSTVTLQVAQFAIVAAAGLGLNWYSRRNAQNAQRIQRLEERQARVRGEERLQLAHELHDIIAHDVTIITMQARRAALIDDPEKTAQIVEGIGESAQQALHDLRGLVMLLKNDHATGSSAQPEDLLNGQERSGETTGAVGLVHDIDGVAQALDQAGFTVDLTLDGELSLVPASLRQALRRTIRELGTNVLKHADPAVLVTLTLSVDGDRVTVSTTNAPASTRPVSSSNLGIEAMRARADWLGGSVTSELRNGRWHTEFSLPLHASNLLNPRNGDHR